MQIALQLVRQGALNEPSVEVVGPSDGKVETAGESSDDGIIDNEDQTRAKSEECNNDEIAAEAEVVHADPFADEAADIKVYN